MTDAVELVTDYLARQEAIAREFADLEIDGAMLTKPASRRYLTGFGADDDGSLVVAAVFLGQHDAALLTSATNAGSAKEEAMGTPVEVWVRPWEIAAAQKIASLGWRRVGFEADAISVRSFRLLSDALGGEVELVDIGSLVERARTVKTSVEIEHIARAAEITDEAFRLATSDLTEGMTEAELAWRIEQVMRDLGAEQIAFGVIVAAGPHGAAPHHVPTDFPISAAEPVVIDMGAQIHGYKADLTRTIWIGDASERLREIAATVSAANDAARAAAVPSATGRSIHEAAASVIAGAGYGEAFVHGVGHGVGIEIHEAPSASPTSSDVLQVGQTLTIEPGIYLDGWGGVRIEDLGVIEAGGFRTLSNAPKQLA